MKNSSVSTMQATLTKTSVLKVIDVVLLNIKKLHLKTHSQV